MIWPRPGAFREWKDWARQLIRQLSEHEERLVRLPVMRVQELPAPTTPGVMMYVKNELLGPELVVSDGKAWRKVSLGGEVMAGVDAREDFAGLGDVGELEEVP